MARRETNAQRAEREFERRTILRVAESMARLIKKSGENKAAFAPESMEDLSAEELKALGYRPDSKSWRKTHAFIGATFCECPTNTPKFLRLVADFLEGKEPYMPGNDWHDKAIMAAYKEAFRRHRVYVPPRLKDIRTLRNASFHGPLSLNFGTSSRSKIHRRN